MGIINRILLFVYTIGIALLSLGAVVVCLQIVPLSYVWNEFLYLSGLWETIAGAVLVFIISIQLSGLSFAGNSRKIHAVKEALVIHGELGEVHVTVEAVRNLLERTARSVPGVRDVKVKVQAMAAKNSPDTQLQIQIQLVIAQDFQVSGLSDEVQKRVQQHLQEFVGIKEYRLDVVIGDISNVSTTKQRVV